MTRGISKILIYGYGNPGRQDDGLGVMLAEEMVPWSQHHGFGNVQTDSNYQLNLEDAATIADYDLVIFADASKEDIRQFRFERLQPSAKVEFTMHAVSPAFVLHLCKETFAREPETYLLHIRGYAWEFMHELTQEARENLQVASDFIKGFIAEKNNIH